MKIVFLGTNGWYCTDTGETLSILIDTKEYYIVLDAGNGINKLDQYIKEDKPIYLFLSHFHLDHIYGLHLFNKFTFKNNLFIVGQKGLKDVLETIMTQPFSLALDKVPIKVGFIEFPEDEKKVPFNCSHMFLRHSSPTLGYRFELDGKCVVFCTDTGYCENAVTLGKNADLLILECALKPSVVSEEWPHLNPETAARIAKEANAKQLALVHFDAENYKSIDERRLAESSARKVFENTFAAFDDMNIEV